MKNELTKTIEKFSGNVLIIGFKEDSDVLKQVIKNKNITSETHLFDEVKKSKSKRKRILFGNKKISIKKMYKDLKKEKFDYIIVDLKTVKKYLDSFIYNSYKLTNNKLFVVLDDELYDYKELMYRYKRYNAKVQSKGIKDEYLVTIDLTPMKMKTYKRIIFRIRDIFYDVLEFIASIIIA